MPNKSKSNKIFIALTDVRNRLVVAALRAAKITGIEHQIGICIEECGELIQVLSKYKRRVRARNFDKSKKTKITKVKTEENEYLNKIAGEMADVLISMNNTLVELDRLSNGRLGRKLNDQVKMKLKRLENRIKNSPGKL